jgi:sugar phosphate permease
MLPERNITRKRWLRIMPVVFITYSFAYLDRSNFGFAAAGGMERDLHLTAAMLSLLGSLFFLGYFLFQIPGAHYAATKSTKKLIFWSLILWGALAMATGMVSNVTLLLGIRFALGVVESAVMPALLILLSRWFTRKERSKANTFLILGNPATILWMSVVSGYLIDMSGWRGMFILEGAPAILWAYLWWRKIDDHPHQARWLSAEEKNTLEETLAREQEHIKPIKNYGAAFRSPTVIGLGLLFAFWSIGTMGFTMWLPTILHSSPDVSIIETGWLAAAPYCLAIVAMITVSYLSDKTLKRKHFIWPFLMISALAFYGSYLSGMEHFWLSYSLLIIAGGLLCAPFGPFFAMITELLPRNVVGVSLALVNSMGALGSFTGSYVVGYLNGVTGKFGPSFLFMAGSMFMAAIMIIIIVKKPKVKPAERVAVSHEQKNYVTR